MVLDILNIDAYVKTHQLKEVTSSKLFSSKSTEPDPEGLGSFEIFGMPGTPDRKKTYAYIDLGAYFVHPQVFNVLVAIKPLLRDLILGEAEFYIKDGTIHSLKDGETAPAGSPVGTGVTFFYNNFEKIKFKRENDTLGISKERYDFINMLSKEEIFISKFLVIPPFYRDVDMVKSKKNEINVFYARLLNLASLVKTSSAITALYGDTDAHSKIMTTIIEIYSYFVGIIGGTKGFVHKHVMGKTTDYSARLVISTPIISSDTPGDMEVSFDRSCIPLHAAVKCFAPFIVYGVKKLFFDILKGRKYIMEPATKTGGSPRRVELADHYQEAFSSENIHRLINLFYDSKDHRFDYFYLEDVDGVMHPLCVYSSFEKHDVVYVDESNVTKLDPTYRPLTLVEIFYMAAMETIMDKCIYITRYPIEDYHNIYPTKMHIDAYKRTCPMKFYQLMKTYSSYPWVKEEDKNQVDVMFTDTLRLFPIYLKALGADFDGDMCSVQGVFTDEANEAAAKYIYSPANVINIAGDTVRPTGDVTAHTVFALTRKV